MKRNKWFAAILAMVMLFSACSPAASENSSGDSAAQGEEGSAWGVGLSSSSEGSSQEGTSGQEGSSGSEASSQGETTSSEAEESSQDSSQNAGTSSGSSNGASGGNSSNSGSGGGSNAGSSQPENTPTTYQEYRAVWISYLDLNTLLKGKNASQFTSNIGSAFDKVKALGCNTVICQVRPFGDALYDSDYFPWSYTITGTEGKNPGFDPLKIMVEQAHARGLKIEAWVNPYRIRSSGSVSSLSDGNIAKQWYQEGSDAVLVYNNGLYYNPGSKQAQDLIVNGVAEIVRNYGVDGIHFDDYFYPTTASSFDQASYDAYQAEGGTLSLADWRRSNVDTLVSRCYSTVKSIRSSVTFGISPAGNLNNCRNSMYINIDKWLSQKGYVDYICPQIYFGFQNSSQPFSSTVAQWNRLITNGTTKLYIGLAPYKLGNTDAYAGAGVNEWIGTTDLLKRMVVQARGSSHYRGFALFRYDSLFRPASSVAAQVNQEIESLRSILK